MQQPPAYEQQTPYPPPTQPQMGFSPPNQPQMTHPPPTVVTTVTTNQPRDSAMRQAIPELPIALAIVLCIVNFILPGIGTVLAGFSVLCCGNVGQSEGGRFGTFCINFWVGLLQLFLVIFIVGWIWSIMWGIAFVAIAGAAGQQQTTTTTVVSTQPVAVQAVPH